MIELREWEWYDENERMIGKRENAGIKITRMREWERENARKERESEQEENARIKITRRGES